MSTLITSNLTQSGAGDPNIQLQGSQATQFNGLTTHANGVSVTGGSNGTNTIRNLDGSLALFGAHDDEADLVIGYPDSNTRYGISANGVVNDTKNIRYSTYNLKPLANNASAYQTIYFVNVSYQPGNINNFKAFSISGASADNLNAQLNIGFHSNLSNSSTPGASVYNFYAQGNAPSYFNGGIQFSLTHSTGGTQDQLKLDYYEEGEWIPQIWDSASGGNQGSSGTAAGTYTRIGKMVCINFCLENLDTTGMTGTGALRIRNVPFNIGQNTLSVIGSCNLQFVDLATDVKFVSLSGAGGSMIFAQNLDNANTQSVRVADVGSTSIIRGSLIYSTSD